MKKSIIFASLLGILFSGCFGGDSSDQKWTSFIYPDKENNKRSKKYAIHKSLEECKQGALLELDKLGLSTRGTYQCGLNCEYHEGMKVDICEKMSK